MTTYLEIYSEPTQPLFHYTSVGGLQGIVGEKAIWATDIQYLNDSSELKYGVRRLAQTMGERLHTLKGRQAKCAEQFGEWLRHGFVLDHHLFVCCFTENGNQLSQWRGYCPPGKGISVSFHASELVEAAQDQQFRWAGVVYDYGTQTTLVNYLLDALLAEAERFEEPLPRERHPRQSFHGLFEEWDDRILSLAASLKDRCFEEEREWRAISKPIKVLNDARLLFRDGDFTLTPYINFRLPRSQHDGLSFDAAFIGPTSESGLTMKALGAFFARSGCTATSGIHNSLIPLRTARNA
jgi:Protein of unknown function (DUF2971)